MPRKKKPIGEVRSVDLLAQVNLNQRAGRAQRESSSRRRRREESDGEHDGEEAEFHNVCPCRSCARLSRPTVRFMSVIGRHIRAHSTSTKYEVHVLYFQHAQY